MASDLDKKLKGVEAIVVAYSKQLPAYQVGELAEDTIKEIKQAFIDAGWVKPPTVSMPKEGWIEVSTDRGVRHNGVPLMTGKEWYGRFEKELPDNDTDCALDHADGSSSCDEKDHWRRDGRFDMRMEALETARKASGIE